MRLARTLATSLVAGSLALLATPARAEADARTFLERIDRGDEVFLHMLDGYASGLGWANGYLEHLGRPRLFCPPERLAITAQQNADILRRYVAAEPAAATAPAGLALLYALRATFPCPVSTEPVAH